MQLHPDQLERLLTISGALRPDLPTAELYETAVNLLAELSGYPIATIWMRDEGGAGFTLSASVGLETRQAAARVQLSAATPASLWAMTHPIGEGVWWPVGQQLPADMQPLSMGPANGHQLVLPMVYTEQSGLVALAGPAPEPERESIGFIQQCVDQITVTLTAAQMVARVVLTQQSLEEAIARQAMLITAIAELSTPVLPLIDGVLLLPVVGSIDSRRISEMSEGLLQAIEQSKARIALIDITGVPVVDTQVAAALIGLARASALMGCRAIMVGIRPEIAQSLVGLGASLEEIATRASLADGLLEALKSVGWRVSR